MKNSMQKCIIFVFIFIFGAMMCRGSEKKWISFDKKVIDDKADFDIKPLTPELMKNLHDSGKKPRPSVVRKRYNQAGEVLDKKAKNFDRCIISVNFPGMILSEKNVNDESYQKISYMRSASKGEVGKPDVPLKGVFLKIPVDMEPVVTVLEQKRHRLYDLNLIPTQPPLTDSKAQKKRFQKDNAFYKKNTLYPQEVFTYKTIKAGLKNKMLLISLYPVQYNPKSKQAFITSFIQFKVTLKPVKNKD